MTDANPFDQFDAPAQHAPNPFDQFDPKPGFIASQAKAFGNVYHGAIEGAQPAWQQFTQDLTTPIDTKRYVPHNEGLRGELEAPFAPEIGEAAGVLARGLKLGLDVGGMAGGAVEGATAPAIVPLAAKLGEKAGLPPDEALERAQTLNQGLSNIPFAIEGAVRGPHVPEVVPEKFAPVQPKSVYTSPVPANPVLSGETADAFVSSSPIGTVLDAFGEGPKTNWGIKDLAADLDIKSLPQDTITPLVQTYAEATKAFNESFQRSAAASGLVQAGPSITEQLAAARNFGIIGEGEGGWSGLVEPNEAHVLARNEAAKSLPPEVPAFDIHAAARQIAPEVFEGPHGYDALDEQRQTLRNSLVQLTEARSAEATGDIDAKLAEFPGDHPERMFDKAADLHDEREAILQRIRTQGDTPEIAQVRQAIQETDYKMRDMAEQVSAAYRAARERGPVEAPVEPQEAPKAAPASVEQPQATPQAAPQEVTARAIEAVKASEAAPSRPVPANVASDVSAKLIAAGRPAEEADAAGQLVAAHYDARAARFGGALGTGPELYAREAPEIRAGRVRAAVPEREYAQTSRGKIAFRDAQATITLMKDANASTFIHETGHQWLEEMMRDAKDERAPADLTRDAKTVRDYLGAKDGEEISTRQHEKFARSFERYMMEGTAPSKGLADVFAKFKDWLTQIYQTVTKLRAPINDDIRAVFDRLLTKPGEEAVIAPERPASATFADMHEADALHTAPEHADPVGDTVADEIDRIAERKTPDVIPELTNGPEVGKLATQAEGHPIGTRTAEPIGGQAGNAEKSGAVSEGGSNAAGEGSTARERAKQERLASTPYSTVPKAPLSLVEFLKANGGIADDIYGAHENTARGRATAERRGSDLRAIGARDVKGLIRPKAGMSPEVALRKAIDAGYLPESAWNDTGDGGKASTHALTEAIADEISGNKRYSEKDQVALDAHNEAVRANAEIDRVAAELGIDPKGMTAQQFMDAVAEHMSVEDQAKWAFDHASANDETLQDAMQKAQDELGDAWEGSPTEYDVGQPRTLEDLEHDAAESSRAAAAGAGHAVEVPADVGTAERSVPGSDREVSSSGTGSGQLGAENGERGRSTAGSQSEPPAGANARFTDVESPLVDKAGNIRLDNMNAPDDVKAALREIADSNDNFLSERGGVISDASVQQMAEASGLTFGDIDAFAKTMRMGPVVIRAAEKMFIQASQDAQVAAKAFRDAPNEASEMAAIKAWGRMEMLQGTFSRLTSDPGRMLRALSKSDEWRKAGIDPQAAVSEFTGRTPEQWRELFQRAANLETPAQLAKLAHDTNRKGVFDWLQSMYVNALISGPFTHAGYTAAGQAFALFRGVGETSAAAAIGKLRELAGIGEADRAYLSEVPHQLYGQFSGARAGIKAAWQAIKANRTILPPEVEARTGSARRQAINSVGAIPNPVIAGQRIPVGTVIESPGRLVAALHSFNWTTFYSQSIAGQAFRQAMSEGLNGDAFAHRIAKLTQSPTDAMIEQASTDASGGALMTQPAYDSFMGNISRLTNWGVKVPDIALRGGKSIPMGTLRPLKYIDPFVQIQANIQKTAFGRGALGVPQLALGTVTGDPLRFFTQATRDDLSMKNGGAAFDRAAGRILAGTGFMVAAGALASEGLLNSSGPSGPAQAREWQRIHGMPHGLTIGNGSYDMLRMGNLGLQMSVAADLYQFGEHIGDEDKMKVASQLVHAFAQNILDESSMRGPAELMKAIDENDRYGDAWIRNFASSAIPFSVGMSQIARQIDPYSREARTTMDAIKAKIPFLSEELQPRYDVWGQPTANRGWAVTPNQQIGHDPIDEKLYAIGYYPSLPTRKIRGVQLTDQQYADYARIGGRLAHAMLSTAIMSPGFDSMPPVAKLKIVTSVIDGAREQARNQIMMQSVGTQDDIVAKALAAKKAGLH